MASSLANVASPDLKLPYAAVNLFPAGPTYAVLTAFAALFLILTVIWYRKVPAASSQTAEWFLTAGRNMKSGIVAASIVCTWTWAATLMVSSAKGYQHGIAGPYWYAAGATIPLLLFAILAIYLKHRAPMAHTFGEFVRHRFGGPSHRLMLCLGLLSCVIVTAMVVLGGAYALRDLTGLDVRLAVLVIPVAFAFYSALGGLRGSIVVEYVQMVVLLGIALVLTIWFWSGHGDLGIFERLRALPAREGEAYLTMASLAALLFGIINTIGNFGTVFMDQTYWQRAIAAAPHSAGRAFLIGGLAWFAIPFGVATALGVGGLALGLAVPFPYTDIAPTTAAAVFGPLGAWLFLIMLFMAIISTGNAESVAVASLVATDIYKTYVRPRAGDGDILRIARWATLAFALLIGPACLVLHTLAIDMQWLYMTMGIFVGAGVIPLALGLLTDRLTGRGAYWATLGGLVVGLVAWTTATYQLEGAITIEALGRMGPVMIGNLAVILTSALICGIDCARPHARFRFELLRDAIRPYLAPPIGADAAGTPPDSPTRLSGRERRLIRWGIGLAVLLELIIPGGLYLSGIQFGQELFAVWVILSLVWLLMAAGFIILLPIKDHYEIEYSEWLGLGRPPVERSGSAVLQDSIGNRLFLSFLTVVMALGIGAVVSLVKLGSIEYLRETNVHIIVEEALHEDMAALMIPQVLEERSRGEYDGLAAAALSERVKLLVASPYTPPLLRDMISLPESQGPIPYLNFGEKERTFIADSIGATYHGTQVGNISRIGQQRRQAIVLILISLVGTLILGLILTIRTSASITLPIRRLAEASGRFAAGEPPAPPLPVEAADEIGLLTEEFNTMAARIREQVTALKAAEEEFRLIVGHVSDAIVYLDLAGIVRWANHQAVVISGRSMEAMIGRSFMAILAPDASARAEARLAAVRRGESVSPLVEFEVLRPDGSLVWVEANITSVLEGGKVVGRLLVTRDITARRQAEKALQEIVTRHRAILDSAMDAVITITPEGRIMEFNPAAEVMFGYTRGMMIGKEMAEYIIPPSLRERHRTGMARYLATGRTSIIGKRIEITALHADGAEFPVELTITRIGLGGRTFFTAFIRDITARKLAEQALRASEAFKNRILESSPDCIKVLDLEGRLLFMNKGGQDLLEICDIASVLNRPWIEFWKDEHRQKASAAIEAARAGGIGKFIGFCPTATDSPKWWDVLITPLLDASGAPDKLLSISRDITERKQAEEALRESEQRLSQLLEDRERISRDLHDNIIQMLYAIGLGFEECQRLFGEKSKTAGKVIRRVIGDLNGVIRDVRSYVTWTEPKISSGRQLTAAIERLARTMEGAQLLHFRLKVNPAAAERLIAEEAKHLLYIVREAMSNSVRHSRARNGLVSLQTWDGHVRLQVEDDGVGFDQAATQKRGEGLRNIAVRVEKLGGTLEIVSERGQGVRIVIDIPRESKHASA